MSGCNLCGTSAAHELFAKKGWQLIACKGCGLVRLSPMPRPEQIAAMYAPTAGYQVLRLGGPTRYTRWEERRSERLARITGAAPRPGARLLDVGCATGDYLRQAQARGWTACGIERAQHLAIFARLKRGLNVEYGSVEDISKHFGRESFSVITVWDVLEHLPEPLGVMRELYRALEPGGSLYLATPNLNGWVPRYHWRVLKPLWGIWPHPEPPLHVYQFTRRTVRRLFAAAGFTDVRVLHDEIPLWYTSGFLGEPRRQEWLHGEPGAPRARAIYLLTVPVFLAARLAGKGDSMIVCGSRPAA